MCANVCKGGVGALNVPKVLEMSIRGELCPLPGFFWRICSQCPEGPPKWSNPHLTAFIYHFHSQKWFTHSYQKIYTRFHGQNLPGLGGRVGEPNFGNASILGSFLAPTPPLLCLPILSITINQFISCAALMDPMVQRSLSKRHWQATTTNTPAWPSDPRPPIDISRSHSSHYSVSNEEKKP